MCTIKKNVRIELHSSIRWPSRSQNDCLFAKTFNWKRRLCWGLLNNVAVPAHRCQTTVGRLYLSEHLTHVMNPFLTPTLAATIITPSVANSPRQWAPPSFDSRLLSGDETQSCKIVEFIAHKYAVCYRRRATKSEQTPFSKRHIVRVILIHIKFIPSLPLLRERELDSKLHQGFARGDERGGSHSKTLQSRKGREPVIKPPPCRISNVLRCGKAVLSEIGLSRTGHKTVS